MDVLWFHLSASRQGSTQSMGRFDAGQIFIMIDRGDYWQCGYVIPKGAFDRIRAAGLPAFRDGVARLAPILSEQVQELRTWDDVKLLTVCVDRLTRWYRPGFLGIGDAAHAMSPIGGVGVNLAVQDAVATANLLAGKLAHGCPSEEELDAVRRRREFPVKMTQRMQVVVQNNIVSAALKPGNQPLKAPLVMRLVTAIPWLQGITARFVGLGVRPEHVQSPVRA
jgi:2-polyprenyl-6-methoxyphenol hydroxylase-like FAD-dependent oxidoreductase